MSAKVIIDDMDENSGNVFLKSKSPEDNRKIIEMLYADYKAGYAYASETYEALGPTSQSAKFRDIYDALPQETKDDIRRIWGRDNMMVSAENLKAIFGVRKIG